jgi:adenylate cyclase
MPLQQLNAIMFTDIVGYTAMMQVDKELAMRTIKYHRELLEKCIDEHHGKLVEYYGDGSLSIFNSATDAIECSMTLQLHFRYHKNPEVPLRIGIHIGEITVEDDKIFGDGVNLASRIESLGVTGAVLFSENVYQSIRNNPKYKSISLGYFDFKNVENPMEVFAIANDGFPKINKNNLKGKLKPKLFNNKYFLWIALAVIAITVGYLWNSFKGIEKPPNDNIETAAVIGNQSIAVMPFEIYSNDTGYQFIAEGIADEIRYQLLSLSNLKVISRSSSKYYKDKRVTSKIIGDELDVMYILEGSVHQSPEEIRVGVQLINTQTEKIEMSFQPEGKKAKDIFLIENEIAKLIAEKLKLRLSIADKSQLNKIPTANNEAYELYKKGQQLLQRGSGNNDELAESLNSFQKAIKLDPNFARAYVGLCDTYLQYIYWGRKSSSEVLNYALNAAFKALELDDNNGACYGALGAINFFRYDKQSSISYLEKGIVLNPNYTGTYEILAWIKLHSNKFEEALALLKKAQKLDPLSTKFIGDLGVVYYYSGKSAEGITVIEKSIEKYPDDNFLQWMLGFLYMGNGEYNKAIEAFTSRSVAKNTNWMLGYTYAVNGMRDEAIEILEYQLEKRKTKHVPAYMIAVIYMGLNDTENALQWLETDYDEGGTGLFFWGLKNDPKFDSIRSNSRFQALLAKIK